MYDGSIYVRHDVRHQEASTFSKDTSFSLSEAMNGEEHILCFLDLRSQASKFWQSVGHRESSCRLVLLNLVYIP